MRYTQPAVAVEDIGQFYPEEYAAHAPESQAPADSATAGANTLGQNKSSERESRKDPWDRIELAGERRLLDLGCGSGGYLLRMKSHGWNVLGIEPSPRAAEAAMAAGLEVMEGAIPGVDLGSRMFEVVTLLASLPCMPTPMETLSILRNHLTPGGRLIVSVHNTASAAAGLFGGDWQGWDLPRQYNHFTPDSLRRMLDRAGFTAIQIEGRRRTSRWRHSARRRAEREGGMGWRWLSKSRNLCSLMSALMGRGERADELVAAAIKRD